MGAAGRIKNMVKGYFKGKPKGYYDQKDELEKLYNANIPKRHPNTPEFKTLWNNAVELAEKSGEDLEYLLAWAIVYAGEDNRRFYEGEIDRNLDKFLETVKGDEKTTYVNEAYDPEEELQQLPPASAGINYDEEVEEELMTAPSAESITMMLGPMPAIQIAS